MCACVEGVLAQTSMDTVFRVGDVLAVVSIQLPCKVLGHSYNLQKTIKQKQKKFFLLRYNSQIVQFIHLRYTIP